ncbi:MAG: protein-glutamate O-methyltransferase CheR [Novosphingobium sp.]
MSVDAAFAEQVRGVSPGVYAADDFRAIANMVYTETGIVLSSGKVMLVFSRLASLVRSSGQSTFAAYAKLIENDLDERRRAISALTTNHTFFYREAHHFQHFAQEVRPAMLRKLQAGGAIRIWSAGCSSGEETWSLVITLLGEDRTEGKQVSTTNVRVLASDIADQALLDANEAQYHSADFTHVPQVLRRNWINENEDKVTIAEEAHRITRFRKLNLQGDWPMSGQFDVIFCRNVMIYFDQPARAKLIERFAEHLVCGGHLYIGHSEQAAGPAAALFEAVGPTIYRRNAR